MAKPRKIKEHREPVSKVLDGAVLYFLNFTANAVEFEAHKKNRAHAAYARSLPPIRRLKSRGDGAYLNIDTGRVEAR